MKKLYALALAGLFSSACISTASALPQVKTPGASVSLVEQVQAFRRDCAWINGGWRYKRGPSFVVCRPYSPGRGYTWHREGNRFGWYHKGRKEWHNRNW